MRIMLLGIAVLAMLATIGNRMEAQMANDGELLYNGIRLPSAWPPNDRVLTLDPIPKPPYLTSPPAVIPIDVGRQLFIDDFLVEKTTLTRTFHAADYYPANPVLKPDKTRKQV